MSGLILYDSTLPSLKGTLQDMWAADTDLVALHPASRFYTGRVPIVSGDGATAPTAMPYTRLDTPGGHRGTRTSDTEYPLEKLRFHVWTDTAEEGDAIADAVQDCYKDQAFTYSRGRVIDIRYENTDQRQITKPSYTAWETVVIFTMRLMRNRT